MRARPHVPLAGAWRFDVAVGAVGEAKLGTPVPGACRIFYLPTEEDDLFVVVLPSPPIGGACGAEML